MNQTLSKTDNGSAFIKVLCILAIIGSIGAIILTGLAAYVLYTNPASNEASISFNGPTYRVASLTLVVHLFGAIACIVGAMKIYQQKRQGLYYFIPGVLIPDLISGIVFGKIFISGIMLIVFIIPILFIVAFSLHFNKMK